jgi:hypothetical protein
LLLEYEKKLQEGKILQVLVCQKMIFGGADDSIRELFDRFGQSAVRMQHWFEIDIQLNI